MFIRYKGAESFSAHGHERPCILAVRLDGEKVFEKAAQTPHNQYLFLTKRPERLNIQTDLDNLWFGVTVTCAAERKRIEILRRNVKAKHYHVTFEPLSDGVGEVDFSGIGWTVIGTETGNCKGKIPTKKKWADNLCMQAKARGVPVFMKEALKALCRPMR